MRRLFAQLKKAWDKKIDGTGLAVFRMTYSLVLLCEIAQLFYFRQLIFDKVPFIDPAEINFGVPIGIWFFSVVCVFLGAFTRFFTILNYIMSLVVVGTIHQFEYHMFYAYMGINFLLILMPVSQCLSVDRLIKKLRHSNTTFQYTPPTTVRQLYYFIPLFVGVGLVYFDSVFYKLASSMWMEGLGSWLPSSLPMATHVSNTWFLNQEYLVRGIGWYTILFETVFIFLFFRKRWRMFLFINGMILHLGILLEFPIPWFALGVCSIYLLMVPVSFWKKIFAVKKQRPTLTFYYDAECPLCIRTKITIAHLDWFGKTAFKTVQFDAADDPALKDIPYDELLDNIYSTNKQGKVFNGVDTYIQVFSRIFYLWPLSLLLRIPGIYHIARMVYRYFAANRNTERCTEENCHYHPPVLQDEEKTKILQSFTVADLKFQLIFMVLVMITVLQVGLMYTSWGVENVRKATGFYGTLPDKVLEGTVRAYTGVSRSALGLTQHPVFTNQYHFDRYNHIIAVVYVDPSGREVWLPIIDKNGQPGLYIYGSNWVNWTFRVNQLDIKMEKLNRGLERYTAFWAGRHHIDLNKAVFRIKVKKIESTEHWKKDFLIDQINKPWIDAGELEWKDQRFISRLPEIESL